MLERLSEVVRFGARCALAIATAIAIFAAALLVFCAVATAAMLIFGGLAPLVTLRLAVGLGVVAFVLTLFAGFDLATKAGIY